MNKRRTLQNKELLDIIERFETMKEDGKILYLDPEQYEEIFDFYINEKKSDKAVETIDMGLQIHPDNARLIALQVAMYLDEENIEKARETINKILNDDSIHVKLIHAELLIMEGQDEKAKSIIDSFLEKDTDEMDCLDIGFLCLDTEFPDKAQFWFERCLSLNPENDEAKVGICEFFHATEQYEKAIEHYNKLLDENPYEPEYWIGLAKIYFNTGQLDKTVEACDFAIISNAKAGDAYLFKAHALYSLENYQEAVEAYGEAEKMGSLEVEMASLFIAFCYINMEQWDNAYEHCQKAITYLDEDSPILPDLLLNTARCLYNMQRFDEAHNILQTVQERFPGNINAYLNDGQYYLEEGNKETAMNKFNKALEVEPGADTWYDIGNIALSSEDFQLAKQAFQEVYEIDPNYGDLPDNMAHILSNMKEEKDQPTAKSYVLKQFIRKYAGAGEEKPEAYDIEQFLNIAKEDGKTPEEIEGIRFELERLNNLIESFGIASDDTYENDSE